ncbi:MAG: hypothetical protein AB8E82_04740 [Aureispira sp.]
MKSYLNDQKLQQQALQQLQKAIDNELLLQDPHSIYRDHYWNEGKGSAIGCIGQSNDLATIATQLGIPIQILKIQNHIFQFLEKEKAQQFSVDFLNAIPVGQDIRAVWKKYFIWLLAEVDHSTLDRLQHIDLAKTAIELSVQTLKQLITEDIPTTKLEGIIKEINAYRRIVGQGADAGAIEPEYAGWELAKAHCVLEAVLNPSYINHILPQGGPSAMWDFLAEQFLAFITQGKATQNTYYYD